MIGGLESLRPVMRSHGAFVGSHGAFTIITHCTFHVLGFGHHRTVSSHHHCTVVLRICLLGMNAGNAESENHHQSDCDCHELFHFSLLIQFVSEYEA